MTKIKFINARFADPNEDELAIKRRFEWHLRTLRALRNADLDQGAELRLNRGASAAAGAVFRCGLEMPLLSGWLRHVLDQLDPDLEQL
ncbi:hypothetical protein SAMN05877809_108153 [Rhodobacter sp. JA431]|uniref:hypothetical protein n=1 Tax=Rhodobacter sp. JA431 TaxID=570013 RepID=UPI000BDCDF56|nr:hypothetical protein [Rhodobacter sp. JA431]SOC16347.1 hypothetical protein SAMN05877809_108153 [Rhodobacter sp. JA431]